LIPLALAPAVIVGASCGEGGAAPHPVSGVRLVWHIAGRSGGIPAVDSTSVYFLSARHEVLGVDKRTGAVRWRSHTGAAGECTTGFNTVIASDVVAVADEGVRAFDRATGASRWTFRPGGDEVTSFLAADGSTIYAGSHAGRVYAVDARSGAQRWMTVVSSASDVKALRPTVDDGVVYVGIKQFVGPTRGALAALDATTGATRWIHRFAQDTPGLGTGCPGGAVVAGDAVVVSIDDGRVVALDRATGEPRWVAPRLQNLPAGAGGSPENDQRPLAVRAAVLVAGSTTGYLTAVDAATGQERWRATANLGSAVYPLVAGDSSVYVTHLGGQLAALDLRTGRTRWVAGNTRSGGDFTLSPAVDGRHLYVGGPGGYYAFREH